MAKARSRAGEPEPALADHLAGLSIAEIDAMSDQEVAELMGATAEEMRWISTWSGTQAKVTAHTARAKPREMPGTGEAPPALFRAPVAALSSDRI